MSRRIIAEALVVVRLRAEACGPHPPRPGADRGCRASTAGPAAQRAGIGASPAPLRRPVSSCASRKVPDGHCGEHKQLAAGRLTEIRGPERPVACRRRFDGSVPRTALVVAQRRKNRRPLRRSRSVGHRSCLRRAQGGRPPGAAARTLAMAALDPAARGEALGRLCVRVGRAMTCERLPGGQRHGLAVGARTGASAPRSFDQLPVTIARSSR
jgi:hypothetical protein